MVLDAAPGTLVLRSRAPYDLGDPIAVLVTIGTPPVVVDACSIMQLEFGFGATSDAGVLTVGEAGTGTLRLYDPTRQFDPTSGAAKIGTAVTVTMAGVPAFRGTVDSIDHDLNIATVALVDRIARLAAVEFTETNVPAEVSSARVNRILDLAGWPAADRDIASGGVALQSGTVSRDAWSELVSVTRNELGTIFMSADGKLAFRTRATAWPASNPVAVYGCTPSDAYIAEMTLTADASTLVNVLSAARRGGSQATVTDADSLAEYGRHSHVQNDLELANDGDRDLWQAFYLTRQAAPTRGVAGFTTRPSAAALAQMLGYDLGTIVRVFDEHHGATIDQPARWLGAKYSADPTGVAVAVVTGEDESIGPVARQRVIDTPAEWTAVNRARTNAVAAEPGETVGAFPAYWPLGSPARGAIEDALDDASRPTPSPAPTPKPKRQRKPRG